MRRKKKKKIIKKKGEFWVCPYGLCVRGIKRVDLIMKLNRGLGSCHYVRR